MLIENDDDLSRAIMRQALQGKTIAGVGDINGKLFGETVRTVSTAASVMATAEVTPVSLAQLNVFDL